ncbi:hypothetical protein ACFWBS_56005 [Streptomyces mirabilis]|uniref:hypothetical protein n=1 Tax=Streptomyces TaxID=1883 RepID=UPI000BD9DE0B|nr:MULTISPECIES: hypothetical protein [unclassified Streptomyces]QDN74834.1 hypothetical protein FNV64_03240 [Streptomyces sp. S1A1-7]SOE39813.1 hypothetical protein SAMN05442782_11233 [Streptomyces sp. OK228]
MTTRAWFEIDDPDDDFEFEDTERAFVSALSERCMAWAPADVVGEVGRPDGWEALLAHVSLSDRTEPRRHLIDLGVHLVDDHVRGDRLHNQLYLLPDRPSLWALDATGSTERLAELAAEWFRAVLDKPIVLYVWLHDGYAYAARYAFADSGETICQSYAESMAPHGQAAELKAAGHVHGKGWIQTIGLPTPSLYLHIRGDLERGHTVPGVPATTKRGPLPGLWYE